MKQIFSEITEFRAALIGWYERHGRPLPWRENWDPYSILVSELMLQQTQVATVIDYYRRWFERFPTLRDLADASEAEVLHAWQGLGYYARARNLHKAAWRVVYGMNGLFPSALEELIKLPGVGRYTAGAIASFAFNFPAPIVDANIERVVSRLLNLQVVVDRPEGRGALWDFAHRYAQGDNPRVLNSALIELGATICSPRKPLCLHCPVRSFCAAKEPESLPRKRERQKVEKKNEARFVAIKNAEVLLEQSLGKRWHGLWILPARKSNVDADGRGDPFVSLKYPITRFIVQLDVFLHEPPANAGPGQAWHALESIESVPMPSPHRRALERVTSKMERIS
jgi:A/G-specific adenine glycosylase